jgi:hypothetical protein
VAQGDHDIAQKWYKDYRSVFSLSPPIQLLQLQIMKAIVFLVFSTILFLETAAAFSPFLARSKRTPLSKTTPTLSLLVVEANKDNGNLFDDDLFKDDGNKSDSKLGIDIGKMLNPLTPEEAEALKAEASELISDKIAQGIDDIEALRGELQKDLELQAKERILKSERNAQQASKQLLNKIDKLTDGFLSTTKETRESTKRAAAADAANQGKGIELGSWGTLGGASVGMLGSVGSLGETTLVLEETAPTENRILIIADPSQVRMCCIGLCIGLVDDIPLMYHFVLVIGSLGQIIDSYLYRTFGKVYCGSERASAQTNTNHAAGW